MKWPEPVAMTAPLRGVRVISSRDQAEAEGIQRRGAEREGVAFERGVAEGEKRLSEQLLQQRREMLELQNGVLQSLRRSVSEVTKQSESALISLAIEVAEKLVCDLPISQEMVEAAVRSALTQAEKNAQLDISLNPEDLALLKSCDSPLLTPPPGLESIHFHPAVEVSRGGCMVQTRFGTIDNRRETKIALVRQALTS